MSGGSEWLPPDDPGRRRRTEFERAPAPVETIPSNSASLLNTDAVTTGWAPSNSTRALTEPWQNAFPWSVSSVAAAASSSSTSSAQPQSLSSATIASPSTASPWASITTAPVSSSATDRFDGFPDHQDTASTQSRLANLNLASPPSRSSDSPSTDSSTNPTTFSFDPWGLSSSTPTAATSSLTSASSLLSSSNLIESNRSSPRSWSPAPSLQSQKSNLSSQSLFASNDYARPFASNTLPSSQSSSLPHRPSPSQQTVAVSFNRGSALAGRGGGNVAINRDSYIRVPSSFVDSQDSPLIPQASRPSPPAQTPWMPTGAPSGGSNFDNRNWIANPINNNVYLPNYNHPPLPQVRPRDPATPSPPLLLNSAPNPFASSSIVTTRLSQPSSRDSLNRSLRGSSSASKLPSLAIPVTPSAANSSRSPETKLRSGLPDRSTWAMWCGNIPSDATENELWVFFRQRPPLPVSVDGLVRAEEGTTGIESVHLIARSNCAFVNYVSEAHLQQAIASSNGVSLRPNDRRCKPLVCRLRMREDDAKSGVGAQRGAGMHKGYIQASRGVLASQRRSRTPPSKSLSGDDVAESGDVSPSPSTSSTSSSFYQDHFPRRFFVLKAKEIDDLERSIRTGFWSTQGHNENVLDQAYRTSQEGVFLFFSANRSGGFAGYARMAGPIFTSNTRPNKSSSSKADRASLAHSFNEPSDAALEGGTPFPVEWISTRTVPFTRTRAILNSFNNNREVKISRDGTEVEPLAGEQLIREFANGWNTGSSVLSGSTKSHNSLRGASPIPSHSRAGVSSASPSNVPRTSGHRSPNDIWRSSD